MKLRLIVALLITLWSAGAASAQKNEIGLLIGGLSPIDRDSKTPNLGKVAIGTGLAYQVSFAHRLVNGKVAALYFEIPVIGTPGTDVKSSNVFSPRSYSSLFIAPGLKLKTLPLAGVSPYLAAGVGFARLSSSISRQDGQPNTGDRGTTTGVFDFGGGLDVKLAPFISLRGEIRDLISGNPELNFTVPGKQNSVMFAAGVVLRF